MIEISNPRARVRNTACAPPILPKSASPDIKAAMAAGPPRIKTGSTERPWALKYPFARATRNGRELVHVWLVNTTRICFFSCASTLGELRTEIAKSKTEKTIIISRPPDLYFFATASPKRSGHGQFLMV